MKPTVILLCEACLEANVFFSIENPAESHLFQYEPLKLLIEQSKCISIVFDQCQYGLRPPGGCKHSYTRKRTRIVSTLETLSVLNRRCTGTHEKHKHIFAWGSSSVQGKSVSNAKAAGVYPSELCNAWASAVRDSILK